MFPTEPYSQKDIRVHLQRLRELLTISPFQQALTHSDGMSLSLLAAITLKDQEGRFPSYVVWFSHKPHFTILMLCYP